MLIEYRIGGDENYTSSKATVGYFINGFTVYNNKSYNSSFIRVKSLNSLKEGDFVNINSKYECGINIPIDETIFSGFIIAKTIKENDYPLVLTHGLMLTSLTGNIGDVIYSDGYILNTNTGDYILNNSTVIDTIKNNNNIIGNIIYIAT